ncbi:unnamed protein product [Lupinus luteus]|uniref:DUF4408 domain-containing protein n=1 Tax=Lupinus luteus TaxID=3873 RepID=A0AAV1XNE6_LUPLU
MLDESISTSPTFWAAIFSWFTPTVFFVLLQLVIGTIYITSTLANNHKHHHREHQQHQQQQHLQGHHDFQQQQQQLARSPSVLQRLKSINFYSPYSYRSQDPYNHNTQEFQVHEQQQQQQLPRSPSLLQRFKSINLYSYFPTEPLTSMFTTNHDNNVSNITTYEPEKLLQQQEQHVYDTAVVETDEEENEEEEGDVVGKIFHHNYQKGHVEGTGVGSSMDEIYSKLQGQYGDFTRTQSDTKPASGEVLVKLPKKMKKSASSKSAFSHFKEDDIVESRRPATVREKKVTVAAEDDNEVDAKADDFINKFKQQLKLQRLDSIMKKEVIGK